MKTKEQLAEQYAENKSSSDVFRRAHIKDFLAGWEAGQSKWISVSSQEPTLNIELLVKSPNGLIYLSAWRKAYNIFTCQNKDESSYDWEWMEIPK